MKPAKQAVTDLRLSLPTLQTHLLLLILLVVSCANLKAQATKPPPEAFGTTLAQLEASIREKATKLEASSGMRASFKIFLESHKLSDKSVNYSEFVLVRLLFEATRDAGLWNLHWEITNQPPNSDRIWPQWKGIRRFSASTPTATAECDELSALFAFLAARAGVSSVGLLWPYPNHTVAVWTLRPVSFRPIRVVVPTTQIFLSETDFFDTRKFDPWRQKVIYDYVRRDVPDAFPLSKQLCTFFLSQIDKYAGASDLTLQDLRYLREGVFLGTRTPDQAAQKALEKRREKAVSASEDLAAFEQFSRDMRADVPAY